MVPLSHSEQVVSMFHHPLHLVWPWKAEFTPKPKRGRSGPTPLHQLQQFSLQSPRNPPGLCREASAKPAQPSTHRRSAWGGRDEQTLLPVQINERSLRKVPGRGGEHTGHWEPPLERSPRSCKGRGGHSGKTVLAPCAIIAAPGNQALCHLLVQTSPYCLHFQSGLYKTGRGSSGTCRSERNAEQWVFTEHLLSIYWAFTAPPAMPRSPSHL